MEGVIAFYRCLDLGLGFGHPLLRRPLPRPLLRKPALQ